MQSINSRLVNDISGTDDNYFKARNRQYMKNPCQPHFFPTKPESKSHPSQIQRDSGAMDTNDILKALFGTEQAQWEYSEESLLKALELRICQERTKQEYYKVEALNRSIELMKLVAVAKVPTNLIPCVFGQPSQASISPIPGPVVSATQITTPNSINQSPNEQQSPSSPSPRKHHSRGKTIANVSDLHKQQSSSFQTEPLLNNRASEDPMSSFKFGAGSASSILSNSNVSQLRTSLAPRHQLSPSRIGAHAVSSLSRNSSDNRKNINLHRLRHGTHHQRTLSLPASVSIPESRPVEFHRPSYASKTSIFIPDLTGKTPNTVYSQDHLQKKRRVSGSVVKGFEYYRPNSDSKSGYTKDDYNSKFRNDSPIKMMNDNESDTDDTTVISNTSKSPSP